MTVSQLSETWNFRVGWCENLQETINNSHQNMEIMWIELNQQYLLTNINQHKFLPTWIEGDISLCWFRFQFLLQFKEARDPHKGENDEKRDLRSWCHSSGKQVITDRNSMIYNDIYIYYAYAYDYMDSIHEYLHEL